MSETTETIKTVAPFVAPFITAIVDVFVKPKLQKAARFLKNCDPESVGEKFKEYLERSYKKHSFIPILIFQNQQKRLADIYVPLTVRRLTIETFRIDGYPKDFLPKYKKVLIRDTAGMGKSTLMKRLFLACLEEQKGIPVFIELRKLKGDETIVDFIRRELNPINDEFDAEFILNLIRDGNFVFFFDGYDEIAPSEREKATLNLHDFISKTGGNLFIMTSRPETSLASFPDFMEFDIRPMEPEEAFALLRRYDGEGALSAELISRLAGETLENVKEFLGNPLLVSLLYKSYEYKHTIPLKKHIFYRQVYDALFESHDLTKEGGYIRDKFSRLDSDSFHAVLRALGFITIKHGIEYAKDELLAFIAKAKTQCSTIEFRESRFLDDLLQTVPLFSREGNYYRWSHKSLQDYFAAHFIWKDTGDRKTATLRKIAASPENNKYQNLLDLYYDIDQKTFRHTVVYDYLSDFLRYYETPIRVKCSETPTEEDINLAKQLTFDATYILLPYSINKNMLDDDEEDRPLETKIRSYLADFDLDVQGEYLGALRPIHIFGNSRYLITGLMLTKQIDLFNEPPPNPAARNPIFEFQYDMHYLVFFSNSIIFNQNDLKVRKYDVQYLNSIFSLLRWAIGLKILDVDKCRKMKKEIEAEIEREKAGDLYADW